MSETPEQNDQVVDAQAQVGGTDESAVLQNELELLRANNKKLLSEKKNALASMEEMQRQASEKKQADLIQKEDYKTLHSDLRGNYDTVVAERDDYRRQLEESRVERQQDQIKATALAAIHNSGAVNSEQMFSLLKGDLRLEDGNLVALSGGVQVDIGSHLNSLKQPGSGWEHNFAGSGARGMSATGSSNNTSGGKSWSSLNLSEQIAMKVADRENGTNYAQRLQAQG